MSSPPERPIKIAAYVIGALLILCALAVLLLPRFEHLYAKSPANTGHDKLACADCHVKAPGDARQQIQAKVQHWLGNRAEDAAFGHAPVGNAQCTTCHARDQDAHPVHRFLEPRFAEARAELGAQNCVSCHREHKGVRVTMPPPACKSCHQDLELKNEPLDVSHKQLVATQQWGTCLGCHDYHGNHKRVTQKRMSEAYSTSAIIEYLNGGPSPYGRELKFPTKKGTP